MASLAAVWVYPRGAASALRPVPPEVWASGTDIEAALNDTDAGVRERGYDALMSRPDRTSHERVLLAIRGASERDAHLRERLLSTAITRGIELPRDVLADLVRGDDVEGIRLMALDALSGDPAAREVGLAALSDPSEVVRQRARELLTELDSMTRRETSIR
jgi:HEAT repeat protein